MLAQKVKPSPVSKKALTLGISALVFALYVTGVPKFLTKKLHSSNLTFASVTLSTSKLSYKGILPAGNTLASSVVTISGSGAPSTTTTNLFMGDSVWIGDTTTGSLYTVTGTPTSTQFQIGSGLDATDFQTNDLVISSRSAALTVRFISASAIANGAFRVLVPAATTTNNDGIPDHTGFDFGGSTASITVTCPADVGATYDFVTGTATAAAVTINSVPYHAYTCRYSGTGAVSQNFTGGLNMATISAVINPAAGIGHTAGTADQYRMIIQNTSGSSTADTVIDSTTVAVAPIEGVRVTANVDPTLQFSIAGVASGVSACTTTTTVDTTATGGNILPNVPLGTLAISTFTDAAQTLTVSTNAAHGYAVTAIENDQLKQTTSACVDAGGDGYGPGNQCIPDVYQPGAPGTFSQIGLGVNWSNASTQKGFGYALAESAVSGTTVGTDNMETYSSGTSSCTGGTAFCARMFTDNQNGEPPQRLFFSHTVADTEDVSVCYRAVVGATQEAGNYENNITYTATATF